ncbi:glycoside hydrolase family 16 protein [Methylobacterium currus]|uniref:Glycoside hydrolase family 16 protein n=1 Tax=Methylobacterium currus TaxID=2051553 RepID=A0A2R4WQ06_9HYPH|nr:glycoside hydrolase family 16 protein [Methylobacterium currus]AWB23644.1 glycoside hydrolase family 16 protein [Methylobacterium currus]UHC16693.1 glycoside hydrolase family 16 protein [Methylobacterium currus]
MVNSPRDGLNAIGQYHEVGGWGRAVALPFRAAFIGFVTLMSGTTASGTPLPRSIDPAGFGKPTFEETWQKLDAGTDQVRPSVPHRWRTVLGHGSATSVFNRKGSDASQYVDKDFPGVENGKLGSTPLGLDPFELTPGSHVTIKGMPAPADLKPKLFGASYVGGVLTTRFSFSQLFGYFEISARLPTGKGIWPAWWLMPISGQWPQNGELDILEGLGASNEIYCSVHSSALPGKQLSQKVTLPFDVSSGWHRYGVAWSADEIVWYVDRQEVHRVATPADMKQVPMYLLLNVAVGGSWGGYPDASTRFPARFDIQRVTVWKLPG